GTIRIGGVRGEDQSWSAGRGRLRRCRRGLSGRQERQTHERGHPADDEDSPDRRSVPSASRGGSSHRLVRHLASRPAYRRQETRQRQADAVVIGASSVLWYRPKMDLWPGKDGGVRSGYFGPNVPPAGKGMDAFLLISIGAFVGANTRFAVSGWAANRWGTSFPYGTLIVNLAGCLVIGLFLGVLSS